MSTTLFTPSARPSSRAGKDAEARRWAHRILPAITRPAASDSAISGTLINAGPTPLVLQAAGAGCAQLGARLYEMPEDEILAEVHRGQPVLEIAVPLSKASLQPGESMPFEIAIPADALMAGRYVALVDLLIEGIFWPPDSARTSALAIIDHGCERDPESLPAIDEAIDDPSRAAGRDLIVQLTAECEALTSDNAQLTATCEALTADRAELSATCEALTSDKAELAAACEALALDKALLEARVGELEAAPAKTSNDAPLRRVEARLFECLAALESEGALREEVESRLARCEAELARLRKREVGLHDDLGEAADVAPDGQQRQIVMSRVPIEPPQRRPRRIGT